MTIVYIAIGGALGSVLRYLATVQAANLLGKSLPYGTFAVNIIGSFIMGIVIGYLAKTLPHSNELRSFLTIGLLGGFTTFSAFSLDAITLIERGETLQAGFYVLSSVIFAILAVFAGLYIIKCIN